MRFVINPFTELLDVASLTGSGSPPIESITGNSGGAVGPNPATFNINLLGDNTTGLNVVGNLGTYTLTIFGLASSTTQVGTTRYATNAEAAAQTLGTVALTPSNITSLFSTNPVPTSQGGTGRSNPAAHQLMVTNGSSPFTLLGVASNGQIPIGSIGSDPVLANITSTGGTLTITNGPGTINIEASSTGDVQTLTGNTGGAISPTGGNINTVGTGSITIAGSGSTLTTQLTGLTNHAVQVGAGTATLTQIAATANTGAVLQNNSGGDPSYSTATYPSTTTINQILYSSAANTVGGLTTANNGVLTTGTSGTPAITALASDGQLIIGSSAGAPAAATLTAGTGIAITNDHNTITIATTGTTFLNVTPLTHASSPYTVLSTDDFLAITGSVGAFTVKLPNAPTTGRVIVIKDTNGVAATDNIAVTTVGGTVTIDGQTTYTMATNYQSVSVIFDGSNYEVF